MKHHASLQWSQDGSRLVFEYTDTAGQADLLYWAERVPNAEPKDENFVVRGLVPLPMNAPSLEDLYTMEPLAWSPTGNRLFYRCYSTSGLFLSVADLETTSSVQIPFPVGPPRSGKQLQLAPIDPRFSPDEKYLLAGFRGAGSTWNNLYIYWAPVDGSRPFEELIPRSEDDCMWGPPQWLEIDKLPVLSAQ